MESGEVQNERVVIADATAQDGCGLVAWFGYNRLIPSAWTVIVIYDSCSWGGGKPDHHFLIQFSSMSCLDWFDITLLGLVSVYD
jgi:hypothetical protein